MISVDLVRTPEGVEAIVTAHGIDQTKNQRVARLEIFGDGKPGPVGSYTYTLSVIRGPNPEIVASGTVAGYRREQGYWPLVRTILNDAARDVPKSGDESTAVQHCGEP